MKFNVRAFVRNPSGTYDPAPIHDFDDESECFIPMIGDNLRWDETGTTYKVISRHFEYSHRRCALEVEETEPRWPQS